MARILASTPANLDRMARHLRRGGLVGVPTETVYGLAANALDARACAKIFAAKGRPRTDPLIVHVASRMEVAALAVSNPAAEKLMRAFWPGPLTIVLPRRAGVSDIVTAGGPTVALRCPAHPVMRRLLELTGRPLAAPSANPFGYISPTRAEHVANTLGRAVPFVIDGGACRVGVESTIVDVSDPARPRMLRAGEITAAQLRRVLRTPIEAVRRRGTAKRRQLAPGMLTQHYSPHTPLVLHERITSGQIRAAAADEAFLVFRKPRGRLPRHAKLFVLSPDGRIAEAARRLYAGLHELDGGKWCRLHAELAPERGAGVAINDRLRRAAAKRAGA